MLKEISIHNYNGGILVVDRPKPLVDDNDTVLSYFVDARKDYARDNKFYRESIRFKITNSDIEVYYGDSWKRFDLYSVTRTELTQNKIKEIVTNWWEDKEFEEDPNNV